MVWLEVHSELIVTDSGGVQKEAYFHNKLCVTLREETEWVELVNNGYNTLVGSNSDLISTSLKNKVLNKISIKDIYGNGDTAEKIVKILEKK